MIQQFTERGGWWVAGQFLLMVVVLALGVVDRDLSRHPAELAGGMILLAWAAVCGVAGSLALGRKLTPFPKPAAEAELVQRGIYGLMRHPLYGAMMAAGAGWAVVCGSRAALVASLALAIFFDAKARREEHWLRRQFPEYADYERRVRRFIPHVY